MNGLPKLKVDALDLALRPVRRAPHLRGRHRQLLRAAAGVRAAPRLELPDGVTPGVSPLSSPSGLVYRYVLESPDRSAMELKIIQDWVLEQAVQVRAGRRGHVVARRRDDAVPGAARSRRKLAGAGLSVGDVGERARGEQRQCRRRILLRGRTVLLRARARPRRARSRTSATSCSRCTTARPCS